MFKILLAAVLCMGMTCPVLAADHKGIDVSQWQGNIDFARVRESGSDLSGTKNDYSSVIHRQTYSVCLL